MSEPTNAVLAAKLDALKELMETKFDQNKQDHTGMNDHLKDLNGAVAKNSKFRIRAMTFYGFAVFIVPFVITILINKYG